MKLEPREIRRPQRLVPSIHPAEPPSVLDEAFASVTEADLRIDAPSDPAAADNGLADGLREQLAALEKQQRELSRLLDGLNG